MLAIIFLHFGCNNSVFNCFNIGFPKPVYHFKHVTSKTNTGSTYCTSNRLCLEESHLKQSSHIIHIILFPQFILLPARNNPVQSFHNSTDIHPCSEVSPSLFQDYVVLKMDQRECLDLFGPVCLKTRSKQTPLGLLGEQAL